MVTHETRIREIPGSNPGADQPDWGFFRSFPQSTRQMLGWIFLTTIHLTIIYQIHKIKIKIKKLKSVTLTIETLNTQQYEHTALWYTPKDPRRDMTKMLKRL